GDRRLLLAHERSHLGRPCVRRHRARVRHRLLRVGELRAHAGVAVDRDADRARAPPAHRGGVAAGGALLPLMARAKRRQAKSAAGAPVAASSRVAPFSSQPEVVLTLLAAGCVLLASTTRIYETDVWQHLAVGRAMWTTHAIPTLQ